MSKDPYEITVKEKECPFCLGKAWSVGENSMNGKTVYECERCTEPQYGIWPKEMTEKYDYTPDPECQGDSKASCGASEMGVLNMPTTFDEDGNKVI